MAETTPLLDQRANGLPSGKEILNHGDEMGKWMKNIGFPETADSIACQRLIKFKLLKDLLKDNLGSHDGQAANEYTSIIARTFAEMQGKPIAEPLLAKKLKSGFYEIINLLYAGEDLYVLSHPNYKIGTQYTTADSLRKMFISSINAIELSSESVGNFMPRTKMLLPYRTPLAVMEYLHDYEEMNLHYTRGSDGPHPTVQFLTYENGLRQANNTICGFTRDQQQMLTAYVIGKSLAARTLMTLSTVADVEGEAWAAVPRKPQISAGDFVFRTNENFQLEQRPVTFRGGTMRINSMAALINHMAASTEVARNGDATKDNSIEIPLLPNDPAARLWMDDIARWTTNSLLERKDQIGDTHYRSALEQFTDPYMTGGKRPRSPFTESSLASMARHFNQGWLGGKLGQIS